jgi:hypothetical protein
MLNRDCYKTGKINTFIYAVLAFRWVSSCLIYKYIPGYFFDKRAKEIIDAAIKNKSFAEAAELCAEEKDIPKRDKYLAILLNKTPFLYKIIVYLLTVAKKIFRG